jgi:hypothetical protein
MFTRIVLSLAFATAIVLGALTLASAGVPDPGAAPAARPGEAPVPPAPPTPPSAPAPTATAELVMGTAVKDREVQALGEDETFFDGEVAFAWTRVTGLGGQAVVHVWYRDDREVARHALDVGGRRWRTWSRQALTAGAWRVVVLGPAGETLAETRFEVEPGSGC